MARFTGTREVPTNTDPYVSGTLHSELADRVTGIVFCDKDGDLYVEQSISGATGEWDVSTAIATTANVGKGFSEELLAPYYRLRFVPDDDAATVFRLASRLSSAGSR